jgi:DNA repair exonuclease SbcCD ATPase subunit
VNTTNEQATAMPGGHPTDPQAGGTNAAMPGCQAMSQGERVARLEAGHDSLAEGIRNVRDELRGVKAELKAEIRDVRGEIREMKGEINDLRSEVASWGKWGIALAATIFLGVASLVYYLHLDSQDFFLRMTAMIKEDAQQKYDNNKQAITETRADVRAANERTSALAQRALEQSTRALITADTVLNGPDVPSRKTQRAPAPQPTMP